MPTIGIGRIISVPTVLVGRIVSVPTAGIRPERYSALHKVIFKRGTTNIISVVM